MHCAQNTTSETKMRTELTEDTIPTEWKNIVQRVCTQLWCKVNCRIVVALTELFDDGRCDFLSLFSMNSHLKSSGFVMFAVYEYYYVFICDVVRIEVQVHETRNMSIFCSSRGGRRQKGPAFKAVSFIVSENTRTQLKWNEYELNTIYSCRTLNICVCASNYQYVCVFHAPHSLTDV